VTLKSFVAKEGLLTKKSRRTEWGWVLHGKEKSNCGKPQGARRQPLISYR